MNKIVVTRHPALVDYLIEEGVISKDTPVISHASAEDVQGKDVIGVLPLSLASLANTVTEVWLNIPAEKRGKELSLEEVKAYAKGVETYKVSVVN